MRFTFQHENCDHLTGCGEETKTDISYSFEVQDGLLPAVFEHFENFLRSCGYVIPHDTRIDLSKD